MWLEEIPSYIQSLNSTNVLLFVIINIFFSILKKKKKEKKLLESSGKKIISKISFSLYFFLKIVFGIRTQW